MMEFELEKNINRLSANWNIKKKTRDRGCDYEVEFFLTKKMKLLTSVAVKCVFH